MALGLGVYIAAAPAATSELLAISWSAPAAGGPSLDGYRIYKSTDGGANYSLLDTVGSGTTSASVAAAAGDRLYVAAYNDAGESDASNTLTVT